MTVNGTPQDTIAITDRGLAYGDGLFETILVHGGKPVLLNEHLNRLQSGASRLKISLDRGRLLDEIDDLDLPDSGVLKIVLTRGSGGRGYRPGQVGESSRILSIHPAPDYGADRPDQGISVFVCQQRLANQPALAGMKHLNRLEQVLASLEWPDAPVMEGLMLDMQNNVIEGTRSNLFWAEGDKLLTPAVDRCGVDGVFRQYLLRNLPAAREVHESPLDRVLQADQVFVCNSVFGVWPVRDVLVGGSSHAVGQSSGSTDFIALSKTAFSEALTAGQHA